MGSEADLRAIVSSRRRLRRVCLRKGTHSANCRSPIRYAYVLATGYSGTTLLSLLLDSHPRIVSIGELYNAIQYYHPYSCSCGRLIEHCEFFTRVRALCGKEGVEVDLQNFRVGLGDGLGRTSRRLLFGSALQWVWLERARDRLLNLLPIYRKHVEQVCDRNSAIARAIIEASGKDVFVDASKTVARVPHLLRRPDIDLRIIHVVRDVRAYAWSALRHERERGEVENMARYWVRTHKAAIRLGALIGENRYLRFRWEDFCASPEAVLDRICRFLGVEPVDLVSRVNAATHHIIGNEIRLQPVRSIRSDERWREALNPSQRAAADRYGGELRRQFGYP